MLSVVVMGYADSGTIVGAVQSVIDQADPDVEVVVVTSGPDDSADRVRRAFPSLTVVAIPDRVLPGGARNAGVAAAAGDVVAFLAADCVAEPGWVAGRRRSHAQGHAVVASAITNGAPRSLAAWGFHFDVYSARLAGHRARVVRGTEHAAHGCSFTRAALELLGRFDEGMRVGEDTKAAYRLAALGIPVWFEPTVRTAHRGPTSAAALWRDRVRRGAERAGTLDETSTVPESARHLGRVWFGDLRVAARGAGADRRWFWASLPWILLSKAAAAHGERRVRRSRTDA